ncbi:MAG TPA: hypothetical protein VL096_00765, partial [Pirellulaceae bacterium]|nr:hypothetical protein [Pirellulaceae bacterium]
MSTSPTSSSELTDASTGNAWLSQIAIKLGAIVVGYLLFAGLIVALERWGAAMNVRGLGILGLAIDVGLLTALIVWLGWRGNPLASSLGPLLGLLTVFLLFAVGDWWLRDLTGGFWSLRNVQTIAAQSATIAVAALGMTIIMIASGIDLSVGTAAALASVVFAWFLNDDRTVKLGDISFTLPGGMSVAIVAVLLTGLLIGAINGLLISVLRIVPFIITLGTMMIYLGLGKLLAGSSNIRPPPSAVPDWLGPMVAPVPTPAWLAWPLLPNFAWGVWLVIVLA